MEVTGDSDDSDGDDNDSDDTDSDTESDDDTDSDDDDDDDADSDDSDDDNDDSDDDDSDDEDSDDSDDADSDDSVDDSNDTESSDEVSTSELDAFCAQQTVEKCSEYTNEDGFHLCAVNVNTNDCYGVVSAEGIYGKGNFDQGYSAAQSTADQQTQQLNTIVGVLGGIVGLLVILAAAGGYYFYAKSKEATAPGHQTSEVMSMEHDDDTITMTAGDGTALMDDDEEL